MDLAHRGLTPDFTFGIFLAEATIASTTVIYACTLVYFLWFVFISWGIPPLQSDWNLSCDHGFAYASECENNTTTITKT